MGEPFIGEIRMFAGNFAPAGWAFCNGAAMPISQNETLFNLIGTTYGGDGQETFDLPNMQSRIPVHAGTGSSGTTYQLGESFGVESVTLSTQQIPNHTHPLVASKDNAASTTASGNITATTNQLKVYTEIGVSKQFAANMVQPVGGSQPHENLMPILAISFIISLFGVFPQQ